MKRKRKRSYNCMAYALGRKHWMLPKAWDEFAQGYMDEDTMIGYLIEQFNLTPVTRDQMVRGKEYVAFRYEAEVEVEDPDYEGEITYQPAGDFHFMKRHKTGHWTHKRGSLEIQGIPERVVFSDVWQNGCYNYDSHLYLFEVA